MCIIVSEILGYLGCMFILAALCHFGVR